MNYNEWCGRFHCCWIFLQRFFFLKAWWVISESACKKIYVEIQGNDVSCFLHLCNVSTCNWVNKLVFVNCIHQVFILTFNFESSFIEMTFWTATQKCFFLWFQIHTRNASDLLVKSIMPACCRVSNDKPINKKERVIFTSSERKKRRQKKGNSIWWRFYVKIFFVDKCHAWRFYENIINEKTKMRSLCFQRKLKFLSNYVL